MTRQIGPRGGPDEGVFGPEWRLAGREAECVALRKEVDVIGARLDKATGRSQPVEAIAHRWAQALEAHRLGQFDHEPAGDPDDEGWLFEDPMLHERSTWGIWVLKCISRPARRLTRWFATSAQFRPEIVAQLVAIEESYDQIIEERPY
jgi:hypothetical protein